MILDPTPSQAAALIASWYRAALDAVEPAAAVQRHLRRDGQALVVDDRRVSVAGRLILLAVGKAAVAMARGAQSVAGDLIAGGLVITKDGHATDPLVGELPVVEAAHPVPDDRGVRATRQALALVERLDSDDVVLALISGGGSALLEAPRPPLTLADMAAMTDLLLRAGAPIQDLNAVRTPLSLVKGGGLRRAAGRATTVTLILSDVLGNDPRVIASGPTIPATPDPRHARSILDRYGILDRVPAAVLNVLQAPSPSGTANPATEANGDIVRIVGDNESAVRAVALAAAGDGFRSTTLWSERTGEAADLGRAWAEECANAPDQADVLLGGGEATVTVRGDGVGGRNTELALAAALRLHETGNRDWIVASLATDGDDGPTGAAGAIADEGTIERARAAGVDPVAALTNNDSLRVFEAAGGLVRPGPTGTNVNDLYVAVRLGAP